MPTPRRPVGPRARKLAQDFEQCRLVCFNTDGANRATIGWGHTRGLTDADVGKRTITQAQADALLEADLNSAAVELERQVGAACVDAMTANQYDAMVDFVFNEGVIGPTLLKALRARRFDQCPALIDAYVYAHPGGPGTPAVKLVGLVRRRHAETELWAEDEPGTSTVTPPSGILQLVATPAAPAPAAHSRSVVAAITASPFVALVLASPDTLTSAANLVQQVLDKTAGLDGDSHIHQIRGLLAGLGGFLLALGPLALWGSKLVRQLESGAAPDNVARTPA